MKLKISPTLLDLYRDYYTGAYNGKVQVQDVIDKVMRKPEAWSDAAVIGSAYHKLIETLTSFGADYYHVLHPPTERMITFSREMVQPIQYLREAFPSAAHELWFDYAFPATINGFHICMKMRIDMMVGRVVFDHKTSLSAYKKTAADYSGRMQTAAYITAVDAHMMVYNMFYLTMPSVKQLKAGPKQTPGSVKTDTIVIARTGLEKAALVEWMERFLEFCHNHHLINFLSYEKIVD